MPFLGAVQVQVQHSLFYLTVTNATLLALTFWNTTGSHMAPVWMSAGHFFGMVALVLATVMILDYKVMYPHRQAFLNKKTCEFDNPAMDELRALRLEVAELKGLLGSTAPSKPRILRDRTLPQPTRRKGKP
jgi:hypothetical protein